MRAASVRSTAQAQFVRAAETALRDRSSVRGLPTDVDGWIERLQTIARDPKGPTPFDGFCQAGRSGARAAFGHMALVESAVAVATRFQESVVGNAHVQNRTTPDEDTREILQSEQERSGRLAAAAQSAKAGLRTSG